MIAATLCRLAIATTLLTVTLAGVASAGDPAGTWLTEGGKARVKIAACGSALCGNIVWLREPNNKAGKPQTDELNADVSKRNRPVIGIAIVINMKPSSTPDKWTGQVYNAEDGKTYSGSLTLTGPSSLNLEGCALGGMVCKTQKWTRAN